MQIHGDIDFFPCHMPWCCTFANPPHRQEQGNMILVFQRRYLRSKTKGNASTESQKNSETQKRFQPRFLSQSLCSLHSILLCLPFSFGKLPQYNFLFSLSCFKSTSCYNYSQHLSLVMTISQWWLTFVQCWLQVRSRLKQRLLLTWTYLVFTVTIKHTVFSFQGK